MTNETKPIEMPHKIETSRLYLQKRSLADCDELYQVIVKNRDHLNHFMPWVKFTVSIADTHAYLQEAQVFWTQRSTFDYTIRDKFLNKIIGSIGVHSICWNARHCEVGYWLDQLSEGQGVLSEALTALEREIFNLGFHRIEIRCDANNTRSARVALRNGYQYEGLLREDTLTSHQSSTELETGSNIRYRDSVIFAKLQTHATKSGQTMANPWFQGVDFIYLFVEDIVQSTNWYAKVFGVEPTHCSDVFGELQASHQTKISFHRADQKSPISCGGSVAYFKTWDWNKSLRHFTDNGATIYRGPLKIPTGQSIAQLRDPFGQVIGLIGYANEPTSS